MVCTSRARPGILALLVAAVSLGACMGAPIQEISDARQALRAADQALAPQQVPANYEQAEELLARATRELYAGRYDEARAAARDAREAAIAARRVALAIASAQADIEAARGTNESLEEALDLVRQAREAAASGDIDAAVELAQTAQRRAGGTLTDPQ